MRETSVEGCEGEPVETTILVKTQAEGECKPVLEVPNVFTPNCDGRNDLFTVKSEYLEIYKLSIFSRWGDLVYETTNTAEGWNGKISGRPASVGAYYWLASYGADDSVFEEKGFLHLVR